MNTKSGPTGKLLPFCGLVLALLAPASAAVAGGYRVLHAFSGNDNGDGAQPWSPPIEDGAGNLYGTTLDGGANNSGTIYKIAPGGTETVIYSFCHECKSGELPHAGLLADKAGDFYGTATYGGINGGLGVVFKFASDGTETVLHAFAGGSTDGNYPYGGVFMDKSANLYGTTVAGGPDNDGMVYKVAPDGTETALHFFANSGGDGTGPLGTLVADKKGNLYGTTQLGGASDFGTVFKVTPQGKEKVLHTFAGAPKDGEEPAPELVIDAAGNLYGSTWAGGTDGMGTVFKVTPAGTATTLYSFTGSATDGRGPVGGVVMDKSANLYGATFEGDAYGSGGVFQLAPDGTLTVVYSFCQEQNCADGGWPVSGPAVGKSGNLYGTSQAEGMYLEGTVFKLKK